MLASCQKIARPPKPGAIMLQCYTFGPRWAAGLRAAWAAASPLPTLLVPLHRQLCAAFLLLCFVRVSLPEAWVLALHAHAHTTAEPARQLWPRQGQGPGEWPAPALPRRVVLRRGFPAGGAAGGARVPALGHGGGAHALRGVGMGRSRGGTALPAGAPSGVAPPHHLARALGPLPLT